MSPLHLLLFANAQAASLEITYGPVQGTEFDGGEAWYQDPESSANVGGEASGLTAGGSYVAIVNGISSEVECGVALPAGILANWSHVGTDGRFYITAPIGTDAPLWYRPHMMAACGAGGGTPQFPEHAAHRTWLQDDERILRPVTVELAESPSGERVAKARSLVYDVRAIALEAHEAEGVEVEGLWAQLSPSGLEALGPVWRSLVPQPSLASVQETLDENVPQADTRDYAGDEVCFVLDGSSPFTTLTEYSFGSEPADIVDAFAALFAGDTQGYGVYEQSLIAYAGYKLGKKVADATKVIPVLGVTVDVLMEALCVKRVPDVTDFEVCVGDFEQQLASITLGGVDSTSLRFTDDSGVLKSGTVLADIDADVIARLRDVRIRWRRGAPVCTLRPSAEVDLEDTASPERAWLDDWATCTDLEFDADTMSRVLGAYRTELELELVEEDGAIGAVTDGTLFSAEGVWTGTGAQTCAEAWIEPEMDAFLAGWESAVEREIAAAWDAGLPEPGEALAVAPLLAPFDLSEAHPEHYALSATLDHVETSRLGGLELAWTTNTQVRPSSGTGVEPATWVRPYTAPPSWWPTGTDPAGDGYDLALSMTTSHLNQVLRSLSVSDLLHEVPVRPTYAELGYPDTDPNSPAVLTPSVLAYIDPALATVTPASRNGARIYVTSQMAPFVYDAAQLRFELGRLTIELRDDANVGSDAGLWLRIEADLYDPDLDLHLDSSADTLYASLGSASWTYSVTDNYVPGCEGYTSMAVTAACEDYLLESMILLLEPRLDELVADLFAQIPMPLTWDGDGRSVATMRAHEVNRFMGDGVITWTARLERARP